jgi:ribosomal-protein-alanine N-acetyltransferase
MRREDVDQVTEIDKEAFPTQWPPTNYRNELQNRLAHYVVVYAEGQPATVNLTPRSNKIFHRIIRWFKRNHKLASPLFSEDFIVGFAGCWILADETHITEVATRKPYWDQGIGQLLIITLIEIGVELKANLATLEVRVSNTAAQRLYEKFGFEIVGIRKGYYTDNHEDALIMTISDIKSPGFQERLGQLKQALVQKWGLSFFPVMQTEPSRRY